MEAFTDEQSSFKSTLEIVLDWFDAVKTHDVTRATSLCHDDIELEWPRGLCKGASLLGTWLGHLDWVPPGRAFQRGARIVVEPQVTGSDGAVEAVLFEVAAGRLRRIARYRSLVEAFDDCDVCEADEITLERASGVLATA